MRKGYVTVFFSIAVMVSLSLFLGLIYGVRDNAMRMRISEVMDIAMNSAFAEYDRNLWGRYGLVFTDAAYGYEGGSLFIAEEHTMDCINQNFSENDFTILGGKDLLKLNCREVETTNIRFATDNGGQPIFRQAVRYMKYYYKLAYIESIYSFITKYNEYSFTGNEMNEMLDRAMDDLSEHNEVALADLKEEAREFSADDKQVGLLSTLRLVIKDVNEVSQAAINKEALLENREINKGNYENADEKASVTDALFFKEYLMKKCGNYLDAINDSALLYEVEYLISGKASDVANLESVANRILLIREAANLVSLYEDESKQELVTAFAAGVALLIGAPEVEEAIAALVNCIWAYAESVRDVKSLLAGKKVKLVKTEEDWKTGLKLFEKEDRDVEDDEGMTYQDYLRLFLYLENNNRLLKRFMNICETNIKKMNNNNEFRLDFCFDAWTVKAYIKSEYGYEYISTGNR